MNRDIIIVKATGEREPYSREKIIYSIRRAGVPDAMRDQVVRRLEEKLYPEIPTSEIYRHIAEFLGKSAHPYFQSRFSLKKAIMDLGPGGFTFEKYIGAILAKKGFQVTINAIVRGKCVPHEIDVLAIKDQEHYLIECKFHNMGGTKTDIQVALYVQARFTDILYVWQQEKTKHLLHQPWIITNTKCTSQAVDYARCAGMQITGWSYPSSGNLQQMIENEKLYPVTCLISLPNIFKQKLLAQNIVLVEDLRNNKEFLNSFSISKTEKEKLEKEINYLLN